MTPSIAAAMFGYSVGWAVAAAARAWWGHTALAPVPLRWRRGAR